MPIFTDYLLELSFLLRVIIAMLLGFIIGLERKYRYKEAGIKTHAIVSVGACLMMIISKYGFEDIGGTDGARIAAQIVSGIGFLGAGIIMYRRDSLRGVTTAAGIWATAAIGMAAGAGQYVLAAGTTVIIIFIQWITRMPIRLFLPKRFYIYRIKFICSEDDREINKIKCIFGIKQFSRINYHTSSDKVNAIAEISTNHALSDDQIRRVIFDNKFVTSIERIYQFDGNE